jgi:hypothetical protein
MDKDDSTPERLKNRSHGSREGDSLCLKRRFDRVVGLSSRPSIPARFDWANQRRGVNWAASAQGLASRFSPGLS